MTKYGILNDPACENVYGIGKTRAVMVSAPIDCLEKQSGRAADRVILITAEDYHRLRASEFEPVIAQLEDAPRKHHNAGPRNRWGNLV